MFFDRSKLIIRPLEERIHDLDINMMMPLLKVDTDNRLIKKVAGRITAAHKEDKSIIMMIGGHVIRSGTQRYIIDLMEKGFISCVAMNGSGIIHDYELSLIGATTESVAHYVTSGQFGLWKETGRINDIINRAHNEGMGMGEAVGRAIYEGDFPYKRFSILSAGYRLQIPVTVHVGIGYDIIHEHPNCSGAATGETSYRDFLRFTKMLLNLSGGVVMNFGSAVMAPEVFLKALSMARNVAHQEGKDISHFTTLVCDLYDLPAEYTSEPPKDTVEYYFRSWKTMLVRTVACGGESFYIKGRHSETIPALWTAINELEETPVVC